MGAASDEEVPVVSTALYDTDFPGFVEVTTTPPASPRVAWRGA